MVAAALGAIAITTVACTSEPETVPAPSFAQSSAQIVATQANAYPVNLIFVAADDDPIWERLSGVTVTDDLEVGPGQFDLIRGEGPDGYSLGNVSFEVDIPNGGVEFSSVELHYTDRTEPVQVDVGSWSLHAAPANEFATADTNAEVAAMADCTTADLPVPKTVASINDFHTGSEDVALQEASLNPEAGTITVSLSCDGDADFYIISPTLDYNDTTATTMTTRFAPIAIGFQDIDDDDIHRIQSR